MYVYLGRIPAPQIHAEKASIQARIASHRKWSGRRNRLKIKAWLWGRKGSGPYALLLFKNTQMTAPAKGAAVRDSAA